MNSVSENFFPLSHSLVLASSVTSGTLKWNSGGKCKQTYIYSISKQKIYETFSKVLQWLSNIRAKIVYMIDIEYRCWLYFNQTSLCQCPSREESRKKASQVLNILILVEVYLKNNQKTVHKVKGFKIQYFYATVRGSNFAKKFRSRWKWFPFKVNIAWKDESKRLIIEWSRKTEIIKLKQ